MKIFVFGDSHSSSGFRGPEWPNVPLEWPYFVFYMPDKTAYNLYKYHEQLYDMLSTINKKAQILFLFGEIDCRAHVNRISVESNTPIDLVIDSIVNNYISYIKKLSYEYRNVSILNVPPTGNEDNIYNIKYYPNKLNRSIITNIFNRKLKELCGRFDLNFIDVYNLLVDNNGDRLNKYIADDCHLNYNFGRIVFENYYRLLLDK